MHYTVPKRRRGNDAVLGIAYLDGRVPTRTVAPAPEHPFQAQNLRLQIREKRRYTRFCSFALRRRSGSLQQRAERGDPAE